MWRGEGREEPGRPGKCSLIPCARGEGDYRPHSAAGGRKRRRQSKRRRRRRKGALPGRASPSRVTSSACSLLDLRAPRGPSAGAGGSSLCATEPQQRRVPPRRDVCPRCSPRCRPGPPGALQGRWGQFRRPGGDIHNAINSAESHKRALTPNAPPHSLARSVVRAARVHPRPQQSLCQKQCDPTARGCSNEIFIAQRPPGRGPNPGLSAPQRLPARSPGRQNSVSPAVGASRQSPQACIYFVSVFFLLISDKQSEPEGVVRMRDTAGGCRLGVHRIRRGMLVLPPFHSKR